MIRVLLVDDHPSLRRGIRTLLEEAPDIVVVGESAEGEEALQLAHAMLPDVVMLDIRLQGMSGIEVARTLRQDLPDIRILILTAHHYEQYVRALFAVGVDGYLLKNADGADLVAGVRAVQKGEQVLSEEIAGQFTDAQARSGLAGNPTLSEREREAITLLIQGAGNKEIAAQLGIGVRTVETYLANAMAKLGARSRSEAIRLAVLRGIVVLE